MKKFLSNPYGAQFSALLIGAVTYFVTFFFTRDTKTAVVIAASAAVLAAVLAAVFAAASPAVLAAVFAMLAAVFAAVFAVLSVLAAFVIVCDSDSKYNTIDKFYIYLGYFVSFLAMPILAYWLVTLAITIK